MKLASCIPLLPILVAGTLTAADWPNWRGPDLDGISRETGWTSEWSAAGPAVLWKANVGIGFSSFAVAAGRVYTMGNENDRDSVICLDAADGREVWRHSYDEPKAPQLYEGGPNSTPTVDGDRVYTLSRSGKFFCLDATTGKVQWSVDLQADHGIEVPKKGHWGLSGSPLVSGDHVVLNAGRAGMAFDRKTGKLVWETGKEPAAYATPVPAQLNGRAVLLVFAAPGLVALDPATGKELWLHPWKTSWDVNAADPIVEGNRIFITSGYNHGAALLDVGSGKPEVVWENKNMRSQLSGGVLVDGHVYGMDEKQLRCIDLASGEVKWTEKRSGKGSVLVADGKLIVLSEKGELMVAPVSPDGFNATASAQVLGGKCWTLPVLANGRIYARNAAGDVVCLDVAAR